MLVVDAVVKSYGQRRAVDGVSLHLEPGETLGLLGPNGAGKTTLVSMIAGLLKPDAGKVSLQGRRLAGDEDPLKRLVGLVPQDLALIEELSAGENLAFFGALQGLSGAALEKAMARCLDIAGLADRAGDRVSTFSGGMKRRLNLAVALLHDPKLLILDEPTVGVDPQSRNAIFESLDALRAEGLALLYTTHYMEEAERLCDRIAIVDEGRLLAEGTVGDLLQRLPATGILRLSLEAPPPESALADIRARPEVRSAGWERGELRLGLGDLPRDTPEILAALAGQGLPWTHVASERASLEMVFLSLTGRSLRDA